MGLSVMIFMHCELNVIMIRFSVFIDCDCMSLMQSRNISQDILIWLGDSIMSTQRVLTFGWHQMMNSTLQPYLPGANELNSSLQESAMFVGALMNLLTKTTPELFGKPGWLFYSLLAQPGNKGTATCCKEICGLWKMVHGWQMQI